MSSRATTELYRRFITQYLAKHSNPSLQDIAIAWSIVAMEPTHLSAPPRIMGQPFELPDVYPKYDHRAFGRLLTESFDEVYDLVVKAIVKVKDIKPLRKGERPSGVLGSIHGVLRSLVERNVPSDEAVMTVILQHIEEVPNKAYSVEERAYSHASSLLQLIGDAQSKEHPLPNPSYGPQVLDIGCGDGSITSSLCARLPNASGHGVDVLPPTGIYKHPLYDLDYVQIKEEDTVYPFEDGIMDLVLAMESVHHIRYVQLVSSMLKKVKRDGLLIIKEHDVTNRHIADYLHVRHLLDTTLIEKKTPEQFEGHYFARYTTRNTLRRAITSQGFVLVPVKDPYEGMSNPLKVYHEVYYREQ